MKAYSMDLRQRVLRDGDDGMTTKAVAHKYHVSDSFVRKLKQRRRRQGHAAPTVPRRRPARWTADADRLRAAVAECPDRTLAELRGRLGLAYSLATLWRALRALGLTLKKKSSAPPSKTGPTSRSGGGSGGKGSRRSTRRG
jgi:transposase